MWMEGLKSNWLWKPHEELRCSVRVFSFRKKSVCMSGGNVDRKIQDSEAEAEWISWLIVIELILV